MANDSYSTTKSPIIDGLSSEPTLATNNVPQSGSLDFEFLLSLYYQRLFPFKILYYWISYGDKEDNYFLNREFSFTLNGDIYTRFKSFPDLESFTKEVKRLVPHKIDIGAVYNVPPRERLSFSKTFLPQSKELVFDIDLTDYNDIRTCCSGDSVCDKCWIFMTIAIKVLNRILKVEFGFKHILWVYSGRRGIHCWVCDERARKLSSEMRRAIAEYITVISSGEGNSRKVNFESTTLHPSLRKSYEEDLLPLFETRILKEQRLLDTEETWQKILEFVPDETLRRKISTDWKENETKSCEEKWFDLKKNIGRMQSFSNGTVGDTKRTKLQNRNPIHDIVFTYTYPRLDINVSIGLNHLLKSPFCVHPKTGRVCVPIDPEKCEEFRTQDVPTLRQLMDQIDSYNNRNAPVIETASTRTKGLKDYKKTVLKDYFALFKTLFLHPLLDAIRLNMLEREYQERQRGLSIQQQASKMASRLDF